MNTPENAIPTVREVKAMLPPIHLYPMVDELTHFIPHNFTLDENTTNYPYDDYAVFIENNCPSEWTYNFDFEPCGWIGNLTVIDHYGYIGGIAYFNNIMITDVNKGYYVILGFIIPYSVEQTQNVTPKSFSLNIQSPTDWSISQKISEYGMNGDYTTYSIDSGVEFKFEGYDITRFVLAN